MASGNEHKVRGAVLGAFREPSSNSLKLTAAAVSFDKSVDGRLSEMLNGAKLTSDVKRRLFYNISSNYPLVSVVDLGPHTAGYNPKEEIDEKKENIRTAIASGIKSLIEAGARAISVDPCEDDESAAEAANLIIFSYDELKSDCEKKPKVRVNIFESEGSLPWHIGSLKADAQNFARYLMETPANYMTPSIFAQKVAEKVKELSVEVIVRDKAWAVEKGMGAFLSVSHGSHVPPLLLEMHYNGADPSKKPIVLVGKGITFDSGGISLKPARNMDKMRADMGGGAVVVSTIYAASLMKLKLNLKAIVPLTENMPGGGATKPGDVVIAMNKKSIQVDNTDAEGRLILADGLCYAQTFNPEFIVDIATLTGAMQVALGGAATGVFSNDADLVNLLRRAGSVTGDRVWPMPLFSYYGHKVKDSMLADLNNIAGKGQGGASIAAAFLKEFVGDYKWFHLDIAGVMENEDDVPYLPKGMSGRPTRTMIEFLRIVENMAE